jgi:hypothetical protein
MDEFATELPPPTLAAQEHLHRLESESMPPVEPWVPSAIPKPREEAHCRVVRVFGLPDGRSIAPVLQAIELRCGKIVGYRREGPNWILVLFESVESASEALQLDGHVLGGIIVGISPSLSEDEALNQALLGVTTHTNNPGPVCSFSRWDRFKSWTSFLFPYW